MLNWKEEVEKKKRRIERSILHKHFTTLLQSLNVTKARLTAKGRNALVILWNKKKIFLENMNLI